MSGPSGDAAHQNLGDIGSTPLSLRWSLSHLVVGCASMLSAWENRTQLFGRREADRLGGLLDPELVHSGKRIRMVCLK
jgi:hypothetical protein